MKISLLLVPYHLGVERAGMGLGPETILHAGVNHVLSSQGHDVEVEAIRRQAGAGQDELAAVSEIGAALAGRVRQASRQGRFPLVLAGNCSACLGVLSGVDTRPVGVVWLDAHGDFNTPETSRTGCLDGMPLATALGLCHQTVMKIADGLPIYGSCVIHIGGRDFDSGERERLAKHQIRVVPARRLKQVGPARALQAALPVLRARVRHVYLHVDLDVLDPAEGRANVHAAPGGLSQRDLDDVIQMIGKELSIGAAALTAYDPTFDEEGRALRAALRIIHTIIDTAAGATSRRESSKA